MTIPGLTIEPRPPFQHFVTVEMNRLPECFTGYCPDCGYSLETCQCERIALGEACAAL